MFSTLMILKDLIIDKEAQPIVNFLPST